jgi:hypothetical protein
MPSVILTVLFAAFSALSAWADPPGRAVDIRYISGQVSVQPGGVNDWVAAVINRPLTSADRVWTDKESRAELYLGTSAVRMDAETSMTLTNVNDQTVQVELDQGALNLWVRRLYDGEVYEIDTPNLAFTVTQPGDYRFDVDPNGGVTRVVVRHGEGEATGQGNAVRLETGEMASFNNGTSLQHETSQVSAPDGFDDWCRLQIGSESNSASAGHVSADVIGAEDLDAYGSWHQTPQYGAVWVPAGVGPGWAPYHDGHWVWVEPWGWTWVDDAPWGFAPAHYGRWVYAGGYWAWAPGPVVVAARPVYAPALVAFVGGAHWGVGVSFGVGFGVGGGVGWFPLGWNEPYVPPYAVSRAYFTSVNVTNIHVTNVTVINNYYDNRATVNNFQYANRTAPGGFTAVPASAMAGSQSVARVAVQVPPSEVARAPLSGAAPVAPSRNSVLGANAGMRASVPPSQAFSRSVVTKSTPPAPPVPFAAKQAELARNPGRPLDPETEQQIRTTLPPSAAKGSGPTGNSEAASKTAPAFHSVPRPPSAGGNSNSSATGFGANGATNATNNGAKASDVAGASSAGGTRSVPRPPNSGSNVYSNKNGSGAAGSSGSTASSHGSTNSSSPGKTQHENNVPKPPANKNKKDEPAGKKR